MLQKSMLTVILSIASGLCVECAAQQPSATGTVAKAGKQHFLIMLKPGRVGFVDAPTAAEQKTVAEHFAYLKKLVGEGKVILGGPSINGDKTFGLVLLEVDSQAEASAVMQADPCIKAGVMTGEVLPFNLALMRGR
jgi:uncharacterized protein YciI